ncbi:uncharacterized protein BDW43DRAFT_22046 [Aspergillus alliaceus]|uniref:uncharacterized protein n=1 Tax=Petromyces alliaceus TaxID=209559 RepID=UPI0012A6D99A|nr:uncharacterized protein BDW43DRAFT_22046 [Aspergillus alliaceus]KAB8227062.1 hypothetical protein BDW43DRAFT_22046 [Aspergillus alliaceus]
MLGNFFSWAAAEKISRRPRLLLTGCQAVGRSSVLRKIGLFHLGFPATWGFVVKMRMRVFSEVNFVATWCVFQRLSCSRMIDLLIIRFVVGHLARFPLTYSLISKICASLRRQERRPYFKSLSRGMVRNLAPELHANDLIEDKGKFDSFLPQSVRIMSIVIRRHN